MREGKIVQNMHLETFPFLCDLGKMNVGRKKWQRCEMMNNSCVFSALKNIYMTLFYVQFKMYLLNNDKIVCVSYLRV